MDTPAIPTPSTNPPNRTPRPSSLDFSDWTLHQGVIAVCCLVLLASFVLPWFPQQKPAAPFEMVKYDHFYWLLLLLPTSAVFTLFFIHEPRARRLAGTIAGLIGLAGVLFICFHERYWKIASLAWGFQLTLLASMVLFAMSGQVQIAASSDLVTKRFNSKEADVFGHWCVHVPHFNTSAQEFYAAFEAELKARKIPGLEMLRLDHREGGLLSEKREYLRILRERLVFDICAAPFGTGYFFSCRDAEIPAQVDAHVVIALMFTGLLLSTLLIQSLGWLLGLLALLIFVLFVLWLLRNVVRLGLADLDAFLIKLPGIGPVYEVFFRQDTYFRQDSRLQYLLLVRELAQKQVETVAAAQGVQLLQCYEKQPLLNGLYRPNPITLQPPAKAA